MQFEWGKRYDSRERQPYLIRWMFKTNWFSIRVHKWWGSDDQRAPHNHESSFVTLVLKGGYTDIATDQNSTREVLRDVLRAGSLRYRPYWHLHKVRLDSAPTITLMLTGPVRDRRHGFMVNGRIVKSNKYFIKYGHH